MEFSRQEYWSGLPCTPPGYLPNPGIESRSPTLQMDSLLSEPPRKTKEDGAHSQTCSSTLSVLVDMPGEAFLWQHHQTQTSVFQSVVHGSPKIVVRKMHSCLGFMSQSQNLSLVIQPKSHHSLFFFLINTSLGNSYTHYKKKFKNQDKFPAKFKIP